MSLNVFSAAAERMQDHIKSSKNFLYADRSKAGHN